MKKCNKQVFLEGIENVSALALVIGIGIAILWAFLLLLTFWIEVPFAAECSINSYRDSFFVPLWLKAIITATPIISASLIFLGRWGVSCIDEEGKR
jgi:hypothetical protein